MSDTPTRDDGGICYPLAVRLQHEVDRGGTGMWKVIVRMTPEMHAAVKRRAVAEDRTMAQTIRRAVKQYLTMEEA